MAISAHWPLSPKSRLEICPLFLGKIKSFSSLFQPQASPPAKPPAPGRAGINPAPTKTGRGYEMMAAGQLFRANG